MRMRSNRIGRPAPRSTRMLSGRSAPASLACRSLGGRMRFASGGPSRSSAARDMRISSFSVSSSSRIVGLRPQFDSGDYGRTKTEKQLQLQLPGLADQGDAKARVWLLADELEARRFVDPASRMKHAVRPERDPLVARVARKADALVHQPAPDAESAGLRLDEQEAELGDRVGLFHEKDRADTLAVDFSDPASLAPSV